MKTIEERIAYAEERIRFWKGHPQQQVWIGIRYELKEILEWTHSSG